MTDDQPSTPGGEPPGSPPGGGRPTEEPPPPPADPSRSPLPPPPPGGYGQVPPPADDRPPAYAQPPAYGPPPAYGQTPAANPYGVPYNPVQAPATAAFAPWLKRVGAYLLDELVVLPGVVVAGIGGGIATSGLTYDVSTDTYSGSVNAFGIVVILLGLLIAIGIQAWNRWVRQGRTGQSLGKQALGITLVRMGDGRPVGALMAFVRDLCHFFDGILCYIGYLWPLWDARRQTFADKIVSTVVLDRPPA